MIKKFQLDNYTPKGKPNKGIEKSDALDRSMVSKRVRAQSHYKSNVRKPNISMFQVNDPEESNDLAASQDNNQQDMANLSGKHSKSLAKARQQLTNNVSLPPIHLRKTATRRYYMDSLIKALQVHSSNYMLRLFRQHFQEVVRGLHLFRHLKIDPQQKKINIQKQSDKEKTIILDLDETLIHCSELLTQCSVRLNIPIENGMTVAAGVNIRPFCRQFLKQVSQIAQVVIFTASSSLYADAVLNHLDPDNKLISHRLYRQHCTFEKGLYIKDLRNINRNPQHMVIVDNSSISYAIQPENGIPIVPFYDNTKDRELVLLLAYLRELVQTPDMRVLNKQHFLTDKYKQNDVRSAILKQLS